MKIHLDTDIGGDMDDLCALAMLLKWHGCEITGVTTVADEGGRRAGYARYVLDKMGRADVLVAAGADLAGGYFRYNALGYPPEAENWREPVPPYPTPLDDAIELLKYSVEQGAVIAGIGPYTNFMLLDEKYPGILRDAKIVLMGGYVYPIPDGFPQWNNNDDWNVQMDIRAVRHVIEHANPTLVPLTVTIQTALRRAHLPRLETCGWLGQLLVRQAEVFARQWGNEKDIGEVYARVPDDLINFQHDPLACAIALGWDKGLEIETVPLTLETRDGWLHEIPGSKGIPTRVVTQADCAAFNEDWVEIVCG